MKKLFRREIPYLLHKLGFDLSLSGSRYLLSLINAFIDNPLEYKVNEYGVLKRICIEHNETRPNVNRCMNYALKTTWNKANNPEIKKLFPYHGDSLPPYISDFVIEVGIVFLELIYGKEIARMIKDCFSFSVSHFKKLSFRTQ